MSKQSESSRPEKRPSASAAPISAELARELALLETVADDEIDLTGIPEVLNWKSAEIGKYYRPIKQPVSMRIDADVLDWARSLGKGYQSQLNELMRIWMYTHLRAKEKGLKVSNRQTMQIAVKSYVQRSTKQTKGQSSKPNTSRTSKKNRH